MISVGNNFFYTLSLPCSLWFFDKNKSNETKNKVLFIDARNYYTVVDRTLNEWSYWQLKNINAIVWLYRGKIDKYKALLDEYKVALASTKPFNEQIHEISQEINSLRAKAKESVEAAPKREKRRVQEEYDALLTKFSEKLITAKRQTGSMRNLKMAYTKTYSAFAKSPIRLKWRKERKRVSA